MTLKMAMQFIIASFTETVSHRFQVECYELLVWKALNETGVSWCRS